MLFDKMTKFADGLNVPTTANATTYSKVVDLRKSNIIDGSLKIFGTVVGAANATGSVTTKVQFSADGKSWTDAASMVQNGHTLIAMYLPFAQKRFMRLAFAVGGTALGSAVKVEAGLVDQFDAGEVSAQTYPPLEDLTAVGDALSENLVLSASSGTITKGSSGTVTVNKGAVTTVEPPSAKYTVTQSGATVTIALAADATDGTAYFVDGLGNKVAYAVTAQASL